MLALALILLFVAFLFAGWVAVLLLPVAAVVVKIAVLALFAVVLWIAWVIYTEHRRGSAWLAMSADEQSAYRQAERAKALAVLEARRAQAASVPPASFRSARSK